MKRKKLTLAAILMAVTLAMFWTARAKERVTNVVATASVTSPVWLPKLQMASEIAALLMPLAGLAWLCVQIYAKLKSLKNKQTKID